MQLHGASCLHGVQEYLHYFSGNVTRNTFLQRASTVGYIGICKDHQLPSQVSNFVPVYPLIVPFLAEF